MAALVLDFPPAAPPALSDDLVEKALAALDAKLRGRRSRVRDAGNIGCPGDAGRYGKLKLAGRDREVFAVMLLDNRHRVLDWLELHMGGLDGCEVEPRVVAKAALLADAAGVICFHNHPSGDPSPSAADRAVTARLKAALALLDIRLLDHFVVGEGEPVSLAAKGWV